MTWMGGIGVGGEGVCGIIGERCCLLEATHNVDAFYGGKGSASGHHSLLPLTFMLLGITMPGYGAVRILSTMHPWKFFRVLGVMLNLFKHLR